MQSVVEGERRRHPRSLVELEASISCSGERADCHSVNVHDISLNGMAIRSQSYKPLLGDTLCLCLSEHRERCSRDHIIEATVVRIEEGLIGIRFDSVGIHILKDVQRLLREGRNF